MKFRNLLKPEYYPGAETPLQARWAILGIAVYLILIVLLIPKDPVFLWAIPFGFVGFMLCLFYQRTLWHLGFFTMPLALQAKEFVGEASLSIPSDLIAFSLLLIYGVRLISQPHIHWRFLKHPISVMLVIWLVWMFVTSFASTIPLVSFKYFISTLWFVIGFYTLSGIFFREQAQMFHMFSIIAPPLLAVIVYSLVLHGLRGFTHEASYTISRPFYIEHTVYGGSITLFFPAFFLLSFSHYVSSQWKIFWRIATVILFLGIILSYTRASWLGLIAGMALLFVLYNWHWLKKLIPIVSGLMIILVFYFITQLAQHNFREVNKHDDDLIHRITSIFDTKTDDSNKERINRWTAAYNMVKEKPLLGHGPGTYAMLYAPYQESRQLTIISTMHGDQGTTHNEYLLAASEMGIMGACIVLGLFIATIIRGIKGFYQAPNAQQRLLYAAAVCGLTTYYVHSIFNNLLDQEKMAIPMYAMMAMITSLDVFHNTRWINRYMIRWGSEK